MAVSESRLTVMPLGVCFQATKSGIMMKPP